MAEPSTYYTLLTDNGRAAETNALALGTSLNLTHLAVGDGNGSDVTPNPAAEALVNEVHRVAVSRVDVHDDEPSWLVVEGIIPGSVGGFTIREVGLYTDADVLYLHGNHPATVKPVVTDGASKDLIIRCIVQRSALSDVTLRIDPAVVLASQQYVLSQIGALEADWQQYTDEQISALRASARVSAHLYYMGQL